MLRDRPTTIHYYLWPAAQALEEFVNVIVGGRIIPDSILARLYLALAEGYLDTGKSAQAQHCLQQAFESNRDVADSKSSMVQAMVAWLIAKPEPKRAMAFAAMTSLLAGPMRQRRMARVLAGALHHAEAFEAYAQGKTRQTLTAGIKSIANSRQARHNRGLMAIMARSILHPQLAPKSKKSGVPAAVSNGVGAKLEPESLPLSVCQDIERALCEPIISIKMLAGGFSGDYTYRIESVSHRAILRLATDQTYAAHINGLNLTAKHGLLAPKLLAACASAEGGLMWLLQSIVPGHHFEELDFGDDAQITTILREIVVQLARMHAVPIDGYGRLISDNGSAQFSTLAQWIDGWLHALEDWSRAGAIPEESVPLVGHALAFLLEEANPAPVWCHGDLSGRNLMTQNGHLTGIIDWDDACGCDPAWDVACMINTLELCCTSEQATRFSRVLVDAYLAERNGLASEGDAASMQFLRRVAAFRVIVNAWSLGVTHSFDDPYRMHIAEIARRILLAESAAESAAENAAGHA